MALVMVQGHVCDLLLSAKVRESGLYQVQLLFHGSTAPGFLFASGFVAGLPRAPLSPRAALRRARRLLFVLAVGYWLHLPYFSLGKTLLAGPLETAGLFACHALQVIAVTQLVVLALQLLAPRYWTLVTGALAVMVLILGPFVWSTGFSSSLPPWLAPYLDERTGSTFPVFPHAAFVLVGTVAGAVLGRQLPAERHRRTVRVAGALVVLGTLLTLLTRGRVDFWKISPGYVLLRLAGLLILLRLVEAAAMRSLPGLRVLALLGRETLLVYVLHLTLLYGGVAFGVSPLLLLAGRLSFAEGLLVLGLMLPALLAAAWAWNRTKARSPARAQLALAFASLWFAFAFLLRPW
jgi:Heparan-alpha-glucosaminide N-acetyltransferase, catalytic